MHNNDDTDIDVHTSTVGIDA